jgi:CheY-like chemotaxis protein
MAGKPTILCVDDQAANLQVRATMLEQFGCTALTASGHQSALLLASEEHVDLVVVDYHLANGETGEEVARDLRVLFPALPLIMLTGDSKLPPSACEVVDAVIVKGSSSPGDLMDEIERLLPKAQLRPRHALRTKKPTERSDQPRQLQTNDRDKVS